MLSMYELGCWVLGSSNMMDRFLPVMLSQSLVAWNNYYFICWKSCARTASAALGWSFSWSLLGSLMLLQFSGSPSGAGWLQGTLGPCLGVGVGHQAGLHVSSRLGQTFSWGGGIPRQQTQGTSDFQVSTFILFNNVPWTKAGPVAKSEVNMEQTMPMPRHGYRREHYCNSQPQALT